MVLSQTSNAQGRERRLDRSSSCGLTMGSKFHWVGRYRSRKCELGCIIQQCALLHEIPFETRAQRFPMLAPALKEVILDVRRGQWLKVEFNERLRSTV